METRVVCLHFDPARNVGVAHKLKMAERLEDKKSGSDLEFRVPDVQLAITNKIIDPFLHTYLSSSTSHVGQHI